MWPCCYVVTKAAAKSSKTGVTDIDNFVPDEEMDNSFLAEDGEEEHNKLYEKETWVKETVDNMEGRVIRFVMDDR